MRYNGQTIQLELGENVYDKEEVMFNMRSWGNYTIQAMPRYGKSVVSKDLAIQISKFRQVIIFDFANEWVDSVTHYNMNAPYPDKLVDYILLNDFTFKITEFSNKEDFASFGFDRDQASILADLIRDTKNYHQGDIYKITEILQNIPTNKGHDLRAYNMKYGCNMTSTQHSSTKVTICTHWDLIKKYFWQGNKDERRLIDFKKEFLKGKHIIINLNDSDASLRKFVGRAYIGKILQHTRPVWKYTKPFIFVEEARTFFPNHHGKIQLSSNVQVNDLVTYAPKQGVSIMFIVQHENQLYSPILQNIHAKIVGIVREPGIGKEYEVALDYDPTRNIREFIYMDVNSTQNRFRYEKFKPRVPCMRYVSDK